jgi:hypothetical protein
MASDYVKMNQLVNTKDIKDAKDTEGSYYVMTDSNRFEKMYRMDSSSTWIYQRCRLQSRVGSLFDIMPNGWQSGFKSIMYRGPDFREARKRWCIRISSDTVIYFATAKSRSPNSYLDNVFHICAFKIDYETAMSEAVLQNALYDRMHPEADQGVPWWQQGATFSLCGNYMLYYTIDVRKTSQYGVFVLKTTVRLSNFYVEKLPPPILRRNFDTSFYYE